VAKKAVKKAKDGCELKPGDTVSGPVTCAETGKTFTVGGARVEAIEDDGNVRIVHAHLHVTCTDPCGLTKDEC